MVAIGIGGSIETALIPYNLVHLKAHLPIDTHAAVSPAALDFTTVTALRAVTANDVYHDRAQFHVPSGCPFHLYLSNADAFVFYPATARIIAQMALGEVTCCVTRLFSFGAKDRTIIAPHIHPRMDRRLYRRHVRTLRDLGCLVLAERSLYTEWSAVEVQLAAFLRLQLCAPPRTVVHLARTPRAH